MTARANILKRPDLDKAKRVFRGRAGRVLTLVAEEAARRARILAPVDTGRLRASIEAGRKGRFQRFVKAQTEYAAHVEFGTRHWIGKPFLRPAAESVRRTLKHIWRQAN